MAFAHVTLATRDALGTSRFLEATLRWRPVERPGNIPFVAAWLEMAPGQEVHLVELPDFEPSPFEREYGRHVAIAHPAGDFDALKERLSGHGAELIEADRATPYRRFFFRSPDGYVFEVIEDGRSA